VTVNPVEPALLARAANRIKPKIRSTTADPALEVTRKVRT
jgi:hypothetical protein